MRYLVLLLIFVIVISGCTGQESNVTGSIISSENDFNIGDLQWGLKNLADNGNDYRWIEFEITCDFDGIRYIYPMIDGELIVEEWENGQIPSIRFTREDCIEGTTFDIAGFRNADNEYVKFIDSSDLYIVDFCWLAEGEPGDNIKCITKTIEPFDASNYNEECEVTIYPKYDRLIDSCYGDLFCCEKVSGLFDDDFKYFYPLTNVGNGVCKKIVSNNDPDNPFLYEYK
jgi:hypothetical protein